MNFQKFWSTIFEFSIFYCRKYSLSEQGGGMKMQISRRNGKISIHVFGKSFVSYSSWFVPNLVPIRPVTFLHCPFLDSPLRTRSWTSLPPGKSQIPGPTPGRDLVGGPNTEDWRTQELRGETQRSITKFTKKDSNFTFGVPLPWRHGDTTRR